MKLRTSGEQTSEVLKKLDLAQRSFGQNLLAEDIGDFLDSDALSRLIIRCSAECQWPMALFVSSIHRNKKTMMLHDMFGWRDVVFLKGTSALARYGS